MMANPCEPARRLHGTREPGALPPLHDLARLLPRSLPELEDEPTATGRHHDQPTARVGGIRLRMTWRTERHQPVEIEVRAPLGASIHSREPDRPAQRPDFARRDAAAFVPWYQRHSLYVAVHS